MKQINSKLARLQANLFVLAGNFVGTKTQHEYLNDSLQLINELTEEMNELTEEMNDKQKENDSEEKK